MKNKALSMDEIQRMSVHYAIPSVDILFIAINRYGIRANVLDKRLRFKVQLLECSEIFYLAVCVNTFDSPFYLNDMGHLLLNDTIVGFVFDVEKDTCDTNYFRRAKTELTLNSNMRSQCHGCTFCGTYNLDPEDKIDMSDEAKIVSFLTNFLREQNISSLENLVRVTICTGCFNDEELLVDHILTIYKVFKEFGFNKRIRYIGSQIRSNEAMDLIQRQVPNFSLSLTVECFSNREQRMRKEKASLDMAGIIGVLKKAIDHQFSANYLYVVGLDELSVLESGVFELLPYINRMPIFQVMQNYVSEHEGQRVLEARSLDYYLKARQIIEHQFCGLALRPRSWENYRGLFYTMYQKKPFGCIRI